jgi:hypothetical protein
LAAVGVVEGRRYTMRSLPLPLIRLDVGVRWTARVLTVLLVGVVLVIFIGEGLNPLRLKGIEVLQMALFWTACIGIVLAWRWPVIGGALSLGGMILFVTVELAVTGGFPRRHFCYLMLLPGILFLADGFISRHISAQASSPSAPS